MNLLNKTIVLTGASGGIGQAIASQTAAAGARLILVGRNKRALDDILKKLDGDTTHHCCLNLDLSNEAGIDELSSFCQGLPGGIDILINNAGLNDFSLLEDSNFESIQTVIFVNLIAPMALSSRLLKLLDKKPESLIVNIGSVLGEIGNPGYTTYCASKAGLALFSESLGRELADSDIKVIHLNPRATETAMNSESVSDLNQTLGVKTDSPELVAQILLKKIQNNDYGQSNIGWPERLFIKVNALIPSLVDKSFIKTLPQIKRSARPSKDISKTAADVPL